MFQDILAFEDKGIVLTQNTGLLLNPGAVYDPRITESSSLYLFSHTSLHITECQLWNLLYIPSCSVIVILLV